MDRKFCAAVAIFAVATLVGSIFVVSVAAQSAQRGPRKPWTSPRTPWGDPDLQGTYTNKTVTPFERPDNVAGREFFTAAELAALEKEGEERTVDEGRKKGTREDLAWAYNQFWWDFAKKATSTRTSLVIDPPDGRVPALTPEGRARNERSPRAGLADDWTDRSLIERCITRGLPSAMSPGWYNSNYRITQSPGFVAVEIEMLGGARIIPTDGRPHISPVIRQWMGNSVGRWDGVTLVVETKNFTDRTPYRGSVENLQLVERFTRVGPDEVDYRVTITDPTTFTRPWTLAIPFVTMNEGIFEVACHEANYGLAGILSGAREEERRAAETAKGK